MLFQNEPIDIHALPQAELLPVRPPARNYLQVVLLGTTFFLLVLLAGVVAAYFIADETPFQYFHEGLFVTWLLIAISSWWLGWKGFYKRGYALREKDIIYRQGVLTQTLTTIPFNRVQHCEITQGPIERLYGLKSLEIFTAGGSSSDLKIPGLIGEEAQQLKEYIIKTTTRDGRYEEE